MRCPRPGSGRRRGGGEGEGGLDLPLSPRWAQLRGSLGASLSFTPTSTPRASPAASPPRPSPEGPPLPPPRPPSVLLRMPAGWPPRAPPSTSSQPGRWLESVRRLTVLLLSAACCLPARCSKPKPWPCIVHVALQPPWPPMLQHLYSCPRPLHLLSSLT